MATSTVLNALTALKVRWQALGARERRGLGLAGVLVAVALLWSVALAPALRTLRAAPEQSAALGRTAERMLALQARANWLQAKPVANGADSLKALQDAATALGKQASLQVLGEQATLTLRQVDAGALAPLLGGETAALPSPVEAHLQRDTNAPAAPWSGTLVYNLPPASAPAKP
jgi:general secretion pathway protein M